MGARTAFVSGATGFVGVNLVRALQAAGWRTTALHRAGSDLTYLRDSGCTFAVGDILDKGSLAVAMPERVDAVFHVAADTSAWAPADARQTKINVDGTRNMVAAALGRKARRFVLTSSTSAYGRQRKRISETSRSVADRSWINYERSKWLAEQEVRHGIASGLDAVIINPSAILGPYDRNSWAKLFAQIRDGRVKGAPAGVTAFNHVGDVVAAHIAAVDHGRAGENYILNGEEASFARLFALMAEVQGIAFDAAVMPPAVLRLVGMAASGVSRITGKQPDITAALAAMMSCDMLYATDKADRELGYRRSPVEACVRDSFTWLKAEGHI